MGAMLVDAVRCILRDASAQRGQRRRQFAEAWEWFCDERRDWPFGFASVCDVLELNATTVRYWRRKVTATQQPEQMHLEDVPLDPHGGTRGQSSTRVPQQTPDGHGQDADRERFEITGWDEV